MKQYCSCSLTLKWSDAVFEFSDSFKAATGIRAPEHPNFVNIDDLEFGFSQGGFPSLESKGADLDSPF